MPHSACVSSFAALDECLDVQGPFPASNESQSLTSGEQWLQRRQVQLQIEMQANERDALNIGQLHCLSAAEAPSIKPQRIC